MTGNSGVDWIEVEEDGEWLLRWPREYWEEDYGK
jgi:hypothetical protein